VAEQIQAIGGSDETRSLFALEMDRMMEVAIGRDDLRSTEAKPTDPRSDATGKREHNVPPQIA